MENLSMNSEIEQKIDQLVKILDDGIAKKINGLSFWVGTQQEYDSISVKSETTIYIIKK